jgi:hypothetical protein
MMCMRLMVYSISPGAGIIWVWGGMAGCQHRVSVWYRGSSKDQHPIGVTDRFENQ